MELENREATPFLRPAASYMPLKRNHLTSKNRKCKTGYRKVSRCVRKNKLRLNTNRCPPGYRFRSDIRECEPVSRFASNFNFYENQAAPAPPSPSRVAGGRRRYYR